MMLARRVQASSGARIGAAVRKLDDADRSFVDEAVLSAVLQSVMGRASFGLPNITNAALRDSAALWNGDPAAGYKEMDANLWWPENK